MVLIKHNIKHYVNTACDGGYCDAVSEATEFRDIFAAMQYLYDQKEENIADFEFITDDNRAVNRTYHNPY